MNRSTAMLAIVAVFLSGCSGDDPAAPSGPKRVFVTSSNFQGDLGGLAGADAKCNAAASAAQLGGTFVAWLSTATVNAKDRVTSNGPWHRVDKTTVVFTNKANLTTTPVVAISTNENGVAVTSGVWTGTVTGGTKANGDNCNNWSAGGIGAFIGNAGSIAAWTDGGQANNCAQSTTNRLYCFEV